MGSGCRLAAERDNAVIRHGLTTLRLSYNPLRLALHGQIAQTLRISGMPPRQPRKKRMDQHRYTGLDALRGSMMMLGIVLHASMFYLAAPPPTIVLPLDRNTSYLFDVLFHLIHQFRMPAFFVLAGFFTALLVEKRGLRGTYHNRASRILAPLLAGALTVVPLTAWWLIAFMLSARFGTHDLIPDLDAVKQLAAEIAAKGGTVDEPAVAHLWFLYYLCQFYLLIPLCQYLAAQGVPLLRRWQHWPQSSLLLLVLTLHTAATLWPFRGGQVHEGYLYLKPHWPSLLYFGSFFVCGYVLHHRRALLQILAQRVTSSALIAIVLFPLALMTSHLDHAASGASVPLHAMAVLANGLCSWAMIYFFIGGAMRFFDRASPWSEYLAQSSYWVFLIHLPLVTLAAWWLVAFDLPAVIKFLLVAGFAVVLAFLSFHYCVQKTWISSFLHGRRFDLAWPWQQPIHKA